MQPHVRPFLLLLVAAAAVSAGQTALEAQAPGSPQAAIVAEIERLDSLWLHAYVSRDVATVDAILDEDFVGQIAGQISDKAGVLAGVAASETLEMGLERIRVNVFGDVAVAHAVRRSTARTPDGPLESRFAYTDVYRWNGVRWVCFTGQSAPLPPPP